MNVVLTACCAALGYCKCKKEYGIFASIIDSLVHTV